MVNINFTVGTEPLGLTQYLLNSDKQKDPTQAIAATNMGGRNAYELAEEFRFIHDLRPHLKYSIRHFSISFAPDDQIDSEIFRHTVKRLLELTGHNHCAYFAVQHHDQEHKRGVAHGHIAVSSIAFDGQRISDSNILRRLKQEDRKLGVAIERQIETELGLVATAVRPEAERHNLMTGEYRLKERTGEILPKEKLWQAIDQATSDQPTMPQLLLRIKAQGIEVQFHERIEQDERKVGISFEINGSKFQGGRLGKAYSFGGLQKYRGVDYQAERDDNLLRQINQMSIRECGSILEQEQQRQLVLAAEQLPQPDTEPKSECNSESLSSHSAIDSGFIHGIEELKRAFGIEDPQPAPQPIESEKQVAWENYKGFLPQIELEREPEFELSQLDTEPDPEPEIDPVIEQWLDEIFNTAIDYVQALKKKANRTATLDDGTLQIQGRYYWGEWNEAEQRLDYFDPIDDRLLFAAHRIDEKTNIWEMLEMGDIQQQDLEKHQEIQAVLDQQQRDLAAKQNQLQSLPQQQER